MRLRRVDEVAARSEAELGNRVRYASRYEASLPLGALRSEGYECSTLASVPTGTDGGTGSLLGGWPRPFSFPRIRTPDLGPRGRRRYRSRVEQLQDPPAPVDPVDFIPRLGFGLGVGSCLGGAALVAFGAGGIPAMLVLLAATLGFTLGVCGLLLALRDGRERLIALAATLLNAAYPGYLLAGMPWSH